MPLPQRVVVQLLSHPSPFTVFDAMYHDAHQLISASLVTLKRGAQGFAVAMIIGSVVGIAVARVKIIAYTLCSLLTGIGGLLIAFNVNSLGPTDFGSFYELYAIAGVVLGGCSLRGGSGNVAAVVIGASLIVVLKNLVNILEIPSQLEYVVIGGAILFGVFVDEMFTRRSASASSAA